MGSRRGDQASLAQHQLCQHQSNIAWKWANEKKFIDAIQKLSPKRAVAKQPGRQPELHRIGNRLRLIPRAFQNAPVAILNPLRHLCRKRCSFVLQCANGVLCRQIHWKNQIPNALITANHFHKLWHFGCGQNSKVANESSERRQTMLAQLPKDETPKRTRFGPEKLRPTRIAKMAKSKTRR